MNSAKRSVDKANKLLARAWASMGLPFDALKIDEAKDGIIDVEALVMTTLLVMGKDRLATDLPAWLSHFTDLVNHQKLRSLWTGLPPKHRNQVEQNLRAAPFTCTPAAFKDIFGLFGKPTVEEDRRIKSRISRLNSVEHVAQSSRMIRNRLLYGTGFRADLVTLLQVKSLRLNARQMGKILCASDSTISRILSDLRACRFLDQHNQMRDISETLPGVFLSSYSLWNLAELLDAQEFRQKELEFAALENLDLRFDGFCKEIMFLP
ncbi:MAG: hypothetical protein AB1512_23310 [Thermodesulfobacteriota bacterium]